MFGGKKEQNVEKQFTPEQPKAKPSQPAPSRYAAWKKTHGRDDNLPGFGDLNDEEDGNVWNEFDDEMHPL